MKKQIVVIALAALLSACGGGSDSGDNPGKFAPVYDLSGISKDCAEQHSEVVNTDMPGFAVYVYEPENKCSPEGTNVFSFVMSDSLDKVAGYFELANNVTYVYGYLSEEDMATGSLGSISGDRTPNYASIIGIDDIGGYEIGINIPDKTKTVDRNGFVTIYEDYTRSDFLNEFPKQMHQKIALNLFKLANNQKPDL
ncbi:hypothetical protein MD588_21025 [Photobacterium sp. SDRW27]|uniref:hypothetical protein n=1 Tax=Photobacterium obscurum TaxID=2829490 RepID=UPI0022440270|nr:hypothetical protein [Photobacterium obscurum]MCW8331280.1 hypothetical protein [Photobacterium obscurum]